MNAALKNMLHEGRRTWLCRPYSRGKEDP